MQANGRLRWNSRGLRPQSRVEAAARNARGMDALRTEGYAGKRPAEHFKRFNGLKARKRQAWTPLQTDGWGEWRFEGWQTAGLNALRTDGYMQANGRLQCWNSRGLRPQGSVEAAARKRQRGALGMDALTTEGYARKRPAEHLKGFKRLKAGKRQA